MDIHYALVLASVNQSKINPMVTSRKGLWVFLLFSMLILSFIRSEEDENIVSSFSSFEDVERKNIVMHSAKKNRNNVGGGGGGRGKSGWGWGGGGGWAAGGGGGWGEGGGGGSWYRSACGRHHWHHNKKREFKNEEYKLGEFAQCMVEGRCRGMRLDCPLHCGRPCFYDCRYMCKAHCQPYHVI